MDARSTSKSAESMLAQVPYVELRLCFRWGPGSFEHVVGHYVGLAPLVPMSEMLRLLDGAEQPAVEEACRRGCVLSKESFWQPSPREYRSISGIAFLRMAAMVMNFEPSDLGAWEGLCVLDARKKAGLAFEEIAEVWSKSSSVVFQSSVDIAGVAGLRTWREAELVRRELDAAASEGAPSKIMRI